MGRIIVRLDDVPSGFELFAEGKYNIRVKSHKVETGPSGFNNIYWFCETFGNSDPDLNSKTVVVQTSLAPAALWKLKEFLEKGDFAWEPDGFDPENVYGMEVGGEIIQDNVKGEDRMKVDKFYRLGAEEASPRTAPKKRGK